MARVSWVPVADLSGDGQVRLVLGALPAPTGTRHLPPDEGG
jgi:hypothetical protein